MTKSVAIFGAFDDLRSGDVRLLEEASKLGDLTVLLWPDEMVRVQTGSAPKFPLAERLYVLRALRFVSTVISLNAPVVPDTLPVMPDLSPAIWVDSQANSNEAKSEFCRNHRLEYRVFSAQQLDSFTEQPPVSPTASRKKVVVTGCYDWLHSGHVRFFEEVSQYGDVYVIVGHDANIRLLKGPGHPCLPQAQRR
jgi:cytidyltransferase-like protein